MTKDYFFKNAKWVGAEKRTVNTFSVLRGHFYIDCIKNISLNVIGLGFFKCYINGILINPDTFLPLSSDYEASCDPEGEVMSAHRVYVSEFDITPFIKEGDNAIAVHFGGGWYTCRVRAFGLPKVIYRIFAKDEGITYGISDENCRICNSFVEDYSFTSSEVHNYVGWQDSLCAELDDSNMEKAVVVEGLNTEYCMTDCPRDALIETLEVSPIGMGKRGMIYDCGQNTVGYPVLDVISDGKEQRTDVYFSEEMLSDGTLDMSHSHNQCFAVITDRNISSVQAGFTWFGFRYFEVVGDAVPTCVKVVHANVPVGSDFDCDNDVLNWTYRTFVHTMLCNMHTGHPSDCPHIERRGYTGDGQLTCHAALSTLEARSFYEKWLQDIADGQDKLSGHIQYTAPYVKSGGGPGGWGCAIVEVPYQLYKHYADRSILSRYYDNMRAYIDYLEAHSEYGLVTSDKQGEWCLGDWCGPNILYADKDITSHNQQILLPAAYVNTYFMIRSLQKMVKIAHIIGKDSDIPQYEEKITFRKNAVRAAYFNAFDHNFIMNAQGANAFAVDIGLGDKQTYANMVNYYKKLGHFDTGIFATDILTRVLFEHGDGELALELLTADGEQGFAHWQKNGATTFHEYWDSNRSRSHNHPMFGAAVGYFFEYLLGIRQDKDTSGYISLIIEPQALQTLGRAHGKMTLSCGQLVFNYKKINGSALFNITLPKEVKAELRFMGREYTLSTGENDICIEFTDK